MLSDGSTNWARVSYHAKSAFAVLLSLGVLLGGGWFVFDKVNEAWVTWRTSDDYEGDGKDTVYVTVPPGATISSIADILVEHNVIKSAKTFRDEAVRNPKSKNLQAARYTLKTELPAAKALEMMLDEKNQEKIKATFPEGMTLGGQWTVMEETFGVSRDEISQVMAQAQLGLPEWAGTNPEGFMFPDTYTVGEPVDLEALFRTQVKQFKTVASELKLEERAKTLGVRPLDIVIVASIVEKEAARAQDRALIASVIYNRLKAGRKLQLDSTVHYAVGASGRVTTTSEDRATDSPYNTYLYEGLPPASISNPGKAALQAASSPADTNFLFFTAVDLDTGETLFATNENGHMQNVKKFQAWCQANPGRCT